MAHQTKYWLVHAWVWLRNGIHGGGYVDNELMFSSKTDDWETPQWLFDKLDKEFHFNIDVAASHQNHKCSFYFFDEEEANGLKAKWGAGFIYWMNPPYGREIGKWVQKAYKSSQGEEGCTVVCLLPARTDTKWWNDYCVKSAEIRFFKGRLKFGNAKASAPFPSALVIFKPLKLYKFWKIQHPTIVWGYPSRDKPGH